MRYSNAVPAEIKKGIAAILSAALLLDVSGVGVVRASGDSARSGGVRGSPASYRISLPDKAGFSLVHSSLGLMPRNIQEILIKTEQMAAAISLAGSLDFRRTQGKTWPELVSVQVISGAEPARAGSEARISRQSSFSIKGIGIGASSEPTPELIKNDLVIAAEERLSVAVAQIAEMRRGGPASSWTDTAVSFLNKFWDGSSGAPRNTGLLTSQTVAPLLVAHPVGLVPPSAQAQSSHYNLESIPPAKARPAKRPMTSAIARARLLWEKAAMVLGGSLWFAPALADNGLDFSNDIFLPIAVLMAIACGRVAAARRKPSSLDAPKGPWVPKVGGPIASRISRLFWVLVAARGLYLLGIYGVGPLGFTIAFGLLSHIGSQGLLRRYHPLAAIFQSFLIGNLLILLPSPIAELIVGGAAAIIATQSFRAHRPILGLAANILLFLLFLYFFPPIVHVYLPFDPLPSGRPPLTRLI